MRGVAGSSQAAVAAVASRNPARAAAYARRHSIATAYGSYEELLADPAIECVYISLPNGLHFDWCLRALQAGKHVLCEKPLTATAAEAERLRAAATTADRILVEGFMWRHHPQTDALSRLLTEGAVGQVERVRAVQGFDLLDKWSGSAPADAGHGSAWQDDVRLSPELEGGAIADVGCYCVSAIRFVAGEPQGVVVRRRLGPSGVDLRATGELHYTDGRVGEFECFMDFDRREELEIVGTDGVIHVHTPFLGGAPEIRLGNAAGIERLAMPQVDSYRLEVEALSEAVRDGSAPDPGLGDDYVAQAAVLEAVRRSAEADGAAVAVRR